MKRFIAKNWKTIEAAKRKGLTHPEIYRILAKNGFLGTFNTYYTYWSEVSKMTPAKRKRCAYSKI